MEYRNVIFVGGIHGVGKSTFANQISKKYGIPSYSSSDLISKLKGETFTGKCTKGITSNQDLLIKAIRKHFLKNETYILDGHFCLLDKENHIEKVPLKTFRQIGIKSLIVLTDEVSRIYERLKLRDNIKYDINLIKRFQDDEINYAKKVSLKLNIPIKFINISSGEIDIYLKEEKDGR